MLPAGDYVARFQGTDEDYVDFGPISDAMSGTSWTIIERIKLPVGYDGAGYHLSRADGGTLRLEGADTLLLDGTGTSIGDFAFQLNPSEPFNQIWVQIVGADRTHSMGHNVDGGLAADTWYEIALRYDDGSIALFVDGDNVAGDTTGSSFNDSGNTNRLVLGGIDAGTATGEGALMGEGDIVIGNVAFYSRALSYDEIKGYIGLVDPGDADLEFATDITASGIGDASGSGITGTSGGSPEFVMERYYE